MRRIRVAIFVLFITWLGISHLAQAQCCSAGNPLSFEAGQMILLPGELVFSYHYRHSVADKYYSGKQCITLNAPGLVSKSWYDFSKIVALYGITKGLSIQFEQGYFFTRAEQYAGASIGTFQGQGLGDMHWQFRYHQKLGSGMYILPSVGITLPVGAFDLEKDHVRLPITIQPSSGDFKYHFNIKVLKMFPEKNMETHINLGLEYPNLINSKHFYYKYGTRFHVSSWTSYQFHKNVVAGLLLNFEAREKSTREDKQVVASSGYHFINMAPHLGVNILYDFHLSGTFEMPIYRNYNGIQLGNKYAVSFILSRKINTKKILGRNRDIPQ